MKGSARLHQRVRLRGQWTYSKEAADDHTTVVGDEGRMRHRFELTYTHPHDVALTLRYRDRHREFDDIGASSEVATVSGTLSLGLDHVGRVTATWSHSSGEYENLYDEFGFEQHIVSAHATTIRRRGVQLVGALTYLRTRLDLDIEKVIASVAANLDLGRGYEFDARYNAHNYDDFVVSDQYFTANIVTIELRKRFEF